MKKTKIASILLAAALIVTSFAGCGDSAAKATANDTSSQAEKQQSEKGTMAKVVSLDGDTITVILADKPAGNPGGSGTPPAIGSSNGAVQPNGSAPSDGNKPPEGATPPSVSSDGQPSKDMQGGGQIKFTGDKKTYTLSEKLTVTKGMNDSAAKIDLSDIAVDNVIKFTTETDDDGNETIVSIQVME